MVLSASGGTGRWWARVGGGPGRVSAASVMTGQGAGLVEPTP